MTIELRLCECGCGKSKYGTKRLRFFNQACKKRFNRRLDKIINNTTRDSPSVK